MLENLIINTSTPEFIEKFNMDMETTSDNRMNMNFFQKEKLILEIGEKVLLDIKLQKEIKIKVQFLSTLTT